MSNEDFLSGKVPDIEKRDANLGIDEHKQRMNLQRSMFSSVVSLAVLLYMTAISIGGFVIWLISKNPTLHWHASVLVAAFVIPPTILLVALIRGIFQDKKEKSKDDDSSGLPIADMCKEVVKKSLDSFIKQDVSGKN